ncbi:MAG: Mu transposase domain-containing protein [Acidimicrobiales bacterium]
MPATTRRVGRSGLISFASAKYTAGVWLAGLDVTDVCDGGLVHLADRGVLVATHARRHPARRACHRLAPQRVQGQTRRPTATSVSSPARSTPRAASASPGAP